MNKHWPSWWYGPKGEAAVFESQDDVPRGWHDHPAKHGSEKSADPEKTVATAGAKETKSRAPAKAKSKAGRKPKAAKPAEKPVEKPLDL